MENPVISRIEALREQMLKRGIDIYIVPTSDFHESEYVGEYFKCRSYLTGFSGSAGTAVVTKTTAGLWTDGRYFIQARKQLEGSGITLYPMGEEGVPTVSEFIRDRLEMYGCIGFDGRVVNAKTGEDYEKIAKEKHASLFIEEDLMDLIWKERPQMSKEPFFILEEKYSGCTTADKLSAVRKKIKEEKAGIHILSSLCDIAWLFNIRGNDISHVPVVLSYLVITKQNSIWFLQEDIVTEEQREYLTKNQIEIRPYEEFYAYLHTIKDTQVLIDKSKMNYRMLCSIPKDIIRIERPNPTELLKAVKNPTEIRNTIAAHIKDGVAFTKFMYWLKTGIGKEEITEVMAADYLEDRRREQEHFIELSFDTICAYGANAAMMHYAATPESNATLKPEGFLLVDSGGHYLEGTTDITRTMALGPVTEEMRQYFTAVCRGNLHLASAKFLYGCSGYNLDILAREPLWSMGMDYKCGTGHGVGHILNVHEEPNAFRFKRRAETQALVPLEEGMITTDEPGVYIEGAYGIRIENELLCRKAEKNEYGQFMCFENITYAPIDLDAIDETAMTPKERQLLNDYHRSVYDTLSPYMTDEENRWLREYTRAV